MSMIRVATIEDVPRIADIGAMMHAESPEYRDIEYDRDKVAQTMIGLIEHGVVFLYESGGEIRGGVAGGLSEFWFSRERIAGDFSLFVLPEHRQGMIAVRLVLAFKAWAKMRGARRVTMGITTGIHEEATAQLYLSTGMRRNGLLFAEDF